MTAEPTTVVPTLLERLLTVGIEQPEALAVSVRDVSDWNALLEQARDHGVLGVLAGALAHAGVTLPAACAKDIDRHNAIATLWHEHQRGILAELAGALGAARLPVVALKGPLLAERLYPRPADRHSVDLDLLVAERDLDGALAVLTASGWDRERGPLAEYSRRHHHHLQLLRPGASPLELHFRARVGFGTVYPSEDLIARGRRCGWPIDCPLLVLSPEDEFLYLAVHAAGHGFSRLMWLYDLKLLLRAEPALDWSLVEARARQVRVLPVAQFACRLLHERLGVALPPRPALARGGLRQRVARSLQQQVAVGRGVLALDRLGGLAFTSMLSASPLAASRLWLHHATRAAKRRVQRALPRLVSPDWAG
jgi:hypothetical protein